MPQQLIRLSRPLAAATPALLDFFVFAALLHGGVAARIAQVASFAASTLLGLALLRLAPPTRRPQPREALPLLGIIVAALLLRGGMLALLSVQGAWPVLLGILPALIASQAVLMLGYACLRAQRECRDWTTLAWGIAGYAFTLRLVFAGCVELMPEEAYYWNYAQHLDFGYLDHPPMVAWLIRCGTWLFGQSEFGVRVGALLCGLVTSHYVWRLTRESAGPIFALIALALVQCLPYFFLSGMLMTPDAPLCAAWAAALYHLKRALVDGSGRHWWYAGISLGLGMLSKYTIALVGVAALLYMVVAPPARSWWRRPQPYVAAALALVLFCPVIIWNAQHDWASFAFQTSRRLADRPQFALHKLLLSSIVLLTPTGVAGLVAALARRASRVATVDGLQPARQWLSFTVLIPLAVFALFSLRHEVKLDWTGAPWNGALPLMAGATLLHGTSAGHAWGRLRVWLGAAWAPTCTIVLLLFGTGLYHLTLGIPGLGFSKHIELMPVGWRQLSGIVLQAAGEERGASPVIVGLDRYALASEIAFYGEQRTGMPVATSSANLFGGIGLMYAMWQPAGALEHRDLMLVAGSVAELEESGIASHVGRLGPIESASLYRDGHSVRSVYYRLAYDYHALAAEPSPGLK